MNIYQDPWYTSYTFRLIPTKLPEAFVVCETGWNDDNRYWLVYAGENQNHYRVQLPFPNDDISAALDAKRIILGHY